MRNWILSGGALALTACSAQSPRDQDAATMLADNDPKVCVDENVQRTVLSALDGNYTTYLSNGGPPLTFQAISVTDIKPEIHAITCSAYISFEESVIDLVATQGSKADRTPITFEVRPALGDGGDFVVSVNDDPVLKFRLEAALSEYENKRTNEPQVVAGEDAETESQPSQVPSDAEAEGTAADVQGGMDEDQSQDLPVGNEEQPVAGTTPDISATADE